eukprot:3955375-Prymnesium_polylepis.1
MHDAGARGGRAGAGGRLARSAERCAIWATFRQFRRFFRGQSFSAAPAALPDHPASRFQTCCTPTTHHRRAKPTRTS